MSALCPDGHLSATGDWCDTCGAPIAPGPADAAVPTGERGPAGAPAPADQAPPAQRASIQVGAPPPAGPACPVCAEPRSGSRYCEACAYDFETGSAPAAPAAVPVPPPAVPVPAVLASSSPDPAAPGPAVGVDAEWEAEVCPDRAFFDRNDDDVSFPDLAMPRLIRLTGERTLIGRRSSRRDIRPEIDLSLAPEDRGVSRAHAFLDHADDGRLTVTDLGSANGTWIGEDPAPVPPGRTVPLADGGHIYVGSFTRITIRRIGRPA